MDIKFSLFFVSIIFNFFLQFNLLANENVDIRVNEIIKEKNYSYVMKSIKNDLKYSAEELREVKKDFKSDYAKFMLTRINDLRFSDLLILDYYEWNDGEVLFISTIGTNALLGAGWGHFKDYLYVISRSDKTMPWVIEDKVLIKGGLWGNCINKRSRNDWCSIKHKYYSRRTTKAFNMNTNRVYGAMIYPGSGASSSPYYIFTIRWNKYDSIWSIRSNSLSFGVEPTDSLDSWKMP